MADSREIIELPPGPYLSLSIGVAHVHDELANIREGQTLRLPSTDHRNYCYFTRSSNMVRIEVDGDILSAMKRFVVQFYSKLSLIGSSIGATSTVTLSWGEWVHIWAHYPRSVVIIDDAS